MNSAIISFLLIVSVVRSSWDYTVETYPDSFTNPGLCNLSFSGLACDPDHLLGHFNNTFSGADCLSQRSQQIRHSTKCSCLEKDASYGYCPATNSHGYTISIAIMKSIRMNIGATDTENQRKTIRVFAEALRRRQRRGYCDDDVLIVVVADWKMFWISIGAVAGRILTPDFVITMNKEAELYIRRSNYLNGLRLILDRSGQLLYMHGFPLIPGSQTPRLKHPDYMRTSASTIWFPNWPYILLGLIIIVKT